MASFASQTPPLTAIVANADPALCKTVHREIANGLELTGHLSRFGDLAVFITDPESGEVLHQGENIIEARLVAARLAAERR